MSDILLKEIKLSASPLSFFFILFGFMFLLPGYPILCGVFFVTLGIFQSFQNARETNDIWFSALLPIAKKSVVKGKYLFVILIEFLALLLMTVSVILRMTVLSNAVCYTTNALMNANLFSLGLAFSIFGLFNLIFVGGFFKTAYKFAVPFLTYIIVAFFVITIGESLHHFPGLEILNSFGKNNFTVQILLLAIGIVLYIILTLISYKISVDDFEKIDL